MLSTNEIRVLKAFFPTLGEKTAKELEGLSGLSHEVAFRTLKSLSHKKYLAERKVGRTNVYTYVKTDDFLIFVTYMKQRAERLHTLLRSRLEEYTKSIDAQCVIVFGSYAKGNATKASDIDLLVVSSSDATQKQAKAFKTKYNLNLHVVSVEPHDFKNMKTDNKAFYDDLVEFGIVLYGHDFFHREIYGL